MGIDSADWTPEKLEKLAELWAKGWSTGQIAARLGVSRSAVCGKASRRRDLCPKRTASKAPSRPAVKGKTAPNPAKTKPPARKKRKEKPLRQVSAPPLQDTAPPLPVPVRAMTPRGQAFKNPVPFNEAGVGQCRMFVDLSLATRATSTSLVCGAPVADPDGLGIASSYCPDCMAAVAPAEAQRKRVKL